MNIGKVISAAAIALTATSPAHSQGLLSGDTKLACEAILCLAAGNPPHECDPALRRYFSIHKKKLSDTLKARRRFLELCPTTNADAQMKSLVRALASGAGRCDAESLNRGRLGSFVAGFGMYISDQLPAYCTALANHLYTDVEGNMPRYVGVPERGGHWVEPDQYDAALAEYEARIAREDEERARLSIMGDG